MFCMVAWAFLGGCYGIARVFFMVVKVFCGGFYPVVVQFLGCSGC